MCFLQSSLPLFNLLTTFQKHIKNRVKQQNVTPDHIQMKKTLNNNNLDLLLGKLIIYSCESHFKPHQGFPFPWTKNLVLVNKTSHTKKIKNGIQ